VRAERNPQFLASPGQKTQLNARCKLQVTLDLFFSQDFTVQSSIFTAMAAFMLTG